MGFRFISNSWRAPLQLIDCWLPIPSSRVDSPPRSLTQILQRFTRAGWLGRTGSTTSALCPAKTFRQAANSSQRPRHVRVHHSPDTHTLGQSSPGSRLALSGRINDVCAELERLSALEKRAHPSQHVS